MALNDIEIFVKIAETGSLSKAADILGMPKSTVSRRLSQLEHNLDVKLINRTTRALHLSSVGRSYYEKCRRVLEELAEANNLISGLKRAPSGVLKVSVPYELGLFVLSKMLSDFLISYPEIYLELELSNRFVNLIEEGVDVVLRIGELNDSSLTALKLGTMWGGVYASPQFVKGRPRIVHPSDLPVNDCLRFGSGLSKKWFFHDEAGKIFTVDPQGRLLVNSMQFLCDSAINGLGYVAINRVLALPQVKAKLLVDILPKYSLRFADLYAVFPSRKYLSSSVKAFVDFVKKRLSSKE